MNLPFTPEEFLQNFARYNLAIWPAQIVAYAVGVAAVALTLYRRWSTGRLVAGALALFWIWTGVFYFTVLPLGGLSVPTVAFGVLFILQGFGWMSTGVLQARLSFRPRAGALPFIGSLFLLYAMVIYPILGALSGHVYPRAPMFGVTPCPVTIFTFGMLLWTDVRVPKHLLVIPFLWSLLGVSAAISFGIFEDFGLVVAGLLGTTLIVWRDLTHAPARHVSFA